MFRYEMGTSGVQQGMRTSVLRYELVALWTSVVQQRIQASVVRYGMGTFVVIYEMGA